MSQRHTWPLIGPLRFGARIGIRMEIDNAAILLGVPPRPEGRGRLRMLPPLKVRGFRGRMNGNERTKRLQRSSTFGARWRTIWRPCREISPFGAAETLPTQGSTSCARGEISPFGSTPSWDFAPRQGTGRFPAGPRFSYREPATLRSRPWIVSGRELGSVDTGPVRGGGRPCGTMRLPDAGIEVPNRAPCG